MDLPEQSPRMSVATAVASAGGCATWSTLRAVVSESALRDAVGDGSVVRLRRGRYVLPSVSAHRRAAHARSAVLSHLSAALAHGWPVLRQPARPWVTVPRNRKVSRDERRGVSVTYRDLTARERRRGITGPIRTVLDCAVKLPFDQALAVADSALRSGDVDRVELVEAARELRGTGSSRARRVAAAADRRAANPFESALRAIALGVDGLDLTPQLVVADVGLFATVDLGDRRARVALEAEGFEFHGTRHGLERDCRRYTELVMHGWRVLRYTWDDVVHRPEWVRWTLQVLVAELTGAVAPPQPQEERRAVPG
ncbi:type IV toxin-antitoxin system AbiEi family antitoxin domain-containing protein [Pedococcus soli]